MDTTAVPDRQKKSDADVNNTLSLDYLDWKGSAQLWNQYLHHDELLANFADRVCNETERLFFTYQQ